MNRKTFMILAILAVLASLLAVLGLQRQNSASIAGASAGDKLLPDFAELAEGINEISLTGAGDEPLVTLSRSGEQWSVAELDGYAADTGVINSLLLALGEAQIVEEKTANPDFFPRLGVEDTGSTAAASLAVQLVGESGSVEVILGFDHGNSQRYARLSDSNQSVLIDQNPEPARDPADWADPAILSIAADRVQRVTVAHADGEELVLSRSSPADSNFAVADIPEDRELQYAGVANVTAEALGSLQLDQVAAATDTETAASVSVMYRMFDGLVIDVAVSDSDNGEPWLAFSAGTSPDQSDDAAVVAEAASINERLGSWRYRIPAFKLSQMTRRLEDLLQAPAAASE